MDRPDLPRFCHLAAHPGQRGAAAGGCPEAIGLAANAIDRVGFINHHARRANGLRAIIVYLDLEEAIGGIAILITDLEAKAQVKRIVMVSSIRVIKLREREKPPES